MISIIILMALKEIDVFERTAKCLCNICTKIMRLAVLEMKIWIYWSESNFWIPVYFYIQCSLVKPPPSVQSVVWRYNEFGDKLRDIENRKLCDHMKR
jgi:hypothetical protein